jgi:tetratricopeptide (TPR) repeat protein
MGRRAPDFWSWRKASFQIGTEDERLAEINREPIEASRDFTEDEPLPPLDELLQELEDLKARSPDSPNLPTFYSKIAKVYARQIETGESKDLEGDRSAAIDYFEKAIEGMKAIEDQSAQIRTFRDLGNFLDSQSQFVDAIQAHQHSLTIAQELDNTKGIGQALCNLGDAYTSLGDYQKSVEFYSQSLEIAQSIGNENGIASSLNGLGNTYAFLCDYQKSVECHSQSLKIEQSIGNKRGIAASLGNLGIVYVSLGDYQKSIDVYSQSLEIAQAIGNKNDMAILLYRIAYSQVLLGNQGLALNNFQKAETLFEEMKNEHMVERCQEAIWNYDIIVSDQPRPSIDIAKHNPKKMTREERMSFLFVVGMLSVTLISVAVLLRRWLRR